MWPLAPHSFKCHLWSDLSSSATHLSTLGPTQAYGTCQNLVFAFPIISDGEFFLVPVFCEHCRSCCIVKWIWGDWVSLEVPYSPARYLLFCEQPLYCGYDLALPFSLFHPSGHSWCNLDTSVSILNIAEEAHAPLPLPPLTRPIPPYAPSTAINVAKATPPHLNRRLCSWRL